MLMESFVKLDRKDKYVWDVSGRTVQTMDLADHIDRSTGM